MISESARSPPVLEPARANMDIVIPSTSTGPEAVTDGQSDRVGPNPLAQ